MPVEIRNPNPDALPLPWPLRGVLKGGQALTFRFSREQLERAIPNIENAFRLYEVNSSGPFDGRYATGELAAVQPEWHINFDTGNDKADGSSISSALLTLGELFRRLPSTTVFENDVDIYLYGHNKPTDPWNTEWSQSVPRSSVIFVYPTPPIYTLRQVRVHAMTPRQFYAGTFTAVQVMDWTTNTPYVITDTNAKGLKQTPPVPAPHDQDYWWNPQIDWNGNPRGSNHDQQRVRISGGPRAGAVSWTASANLAGYGIFGGGQNGAIRMSNFCISDPFGYTSGYVTVGITPVIPQPGDPFVVEDLQLLYVDRIITRGNGDFTGSGLAFNSFNFRCINGGDSQNPSNEPVFIVNGGSMVFVNCNFDFGVDLSNGEVTFAAFSYFVNCSGIDGIFISGGGVCYVDAGQYHLALGANLGATMIPDGDVMITTGAFYAGRAGSIWISSAQVWDTPGHSRKAGVLCFDGGTAIFAGNASFYGTNRLWGIDQTGVGPPFTSGRAYAIAAFDGGRFLYDKTVPNIQNMMTIDGRSKFFGIGLSWTRGETAQTIDPATGALSNFRDTTKANLFASYASGGFGGRAIDLETGGLIGPSTSPTAPTA